MLDIIILYTQFYETRRDAVSCPSPMRQNIICAIGQKVMYNSNTNSKYSPPVYMIVALKQNPEGPATEMTIQ